ncbi:hypothetical protein [Streptoalloteichus tenebrarius]|uniref:hypothetical protein n=1 Tax=Streptoalloteichus tenebrarius (strain ATCC 17920 / DSM 40477 / JCM 4838 / CBS 697.72 / NBRC 16177 / NCIMB 11028 / NRRL B-12390 / A12253. 1 / ISP 5477) TaxID=1933 RepID=UPI0035EE7EFC
MRRPGRSRWSVATAADDGGDTNRAVLSGKRQLDGAAPRPQNDVGTVPPHSERGDSAQAHHPTDLVVLLEDEKVAVLDLVTAVRAVTLDLDGSTQLLLNPRW